MEIDLKERRPEQQACVEKVDQEDQYDYVPTTKGLTNLLNRKLETVQKQIDILVIAAIVIIILIAVRILV